MKRWLATLVIVIVATILFVALIAVAAAKQQAQPAQEATPVTYGTTTGDSASLDPWITKPVLSYLLFTKDSKLESDVMDLAGFLSLTEGEMSSLRKIAEDELLSANAVKAESARVVENNTLTLEEKQRQIQAIGYNSRVNQIAQDTDVAVRNLLGSRYPKFRSWIRHWWNGERAFRAGRFNSQHGNTSGDFSAQADIGYRLVYATQYNGYTKNEIALPDKYVKWANLGWCGCPSAYNYPPYTSILVRNPYSVFDVLIKEVGPWNENDNYWDSSTGSNPRRKFTNLPLGKPEAEAAYFDNYNNGKDEFGRIVTNPAGVDLTPTVAGQLGLGYLENSWIYVYYNDLP